jgi:hypothetical protein
MTATPSLGFVEKISGSICSGKCRYGPKMQSAKQMAPRISPSSSMQLPCKHDLDTFSASKWYGQATDVAWPEEAPHARPRPFGDARDSKSRIWDNAGTFWAFPHLHGHVIWSIARQIWSKRRLCLKAFGHSSATFFLVQKRVRWVWQSLPNITYH